MADKKKLYCVVPADPVYALCKVKVTRSAVTLEIEIEMEKMTLRQVVFSSVFDPRGIVWEVAPENVPQVERYLQSVGFVVASEEEARSLFS